MATQHLSRKELLNYFYEENLNPYFTFHNTTEVKTLFAEAIAAGLVDRFPKGKKVLRILDIGCGGGELTRVLLESLVRYRPGLEIYLLATDAANGILSHAQKHLEEIPIEHKNVTIEFKQVGVYPQPAPRLSDVIDKGRFNLIIASFMMHWLDDAADAIEQFLECLNDEGFLCIVQLADEEGSICAEFRKCLFKIGYDKKTGPYEHFFAEEFEEILKERGIHYEPPRIVDAAVNLKVEGSEGVVRSLEFLMNIPRRNMTTKQIKAGKKLINTLLSSGAMTCKYKMLWVEKK